MQHTNFKLFRVNLCVQYKTDAAQKHERLQLATSAQQAIEDATKAYGDDYRWKASTVEIG